MELTRVVLEERRRALEADIIALNGAVQQIDWSLDFLDKLDEGVASEEAAPDPT
jgi:hypothetical protein